MKRFFILISFLFIVSCGHKNKRIQMLEGNNEHCTQSVEVIMHKLSETEWELADTQDELREINNFLLEKHPDVMIEYERGGP